MTARTNRRSFLRFLALGSGATLLAACGQAAQPAAPAKPAEAPKPTSAPAAPAAKAEAKPAEAAKPTAAPAQAAPAAKAAAPAGKLTIAQGLDPRSLWGSSSTTQQEINVSEQITEKLIEFNVDANDFEPRLATEWRQLDDTTFQMKLRPNVKFTNGEEFNAEAAKFNIETMLKANAYAAFTGVIAGADVVDPLTINVKTKNPTLLHLPALAMGSFQYPPKYFQEQGQDAFGRKPIGTGPFTFGEWVKDSHITMEANPNYWNGAPAVKTVVFRNIPEGAAKLAALEAGEVDLIIDVPLDAIERIERNTNLQLLSRPSNRLFNLTMSTLTDTPLKKAEVRQAMRYAVDVPALITGLFKGRARQLQGQPLGPGAFGFDPNRKAFPYDPEKVKQMFAAAGHPDGFEITFKYTAGRYAQDKETGQVIAAQLAKVGVRTKQEVLESGTFLTQLNSLQLNDMYFSGSLAPPDAHFTFQTYQTGFRYAYYSNPAVDELINKAAATTNKDERMKMYLQIHDLLDQDPPGVPLFSPDDFYAGTKKVGGFTPRASQFTDIRTVTLS
jgi:peptide/nickel transport system substrate-binding protein